MVGLVCFGLVLAMSQLFWALHYVTTPDACLPTYPTIANHHTSEHIGSVTQDPSDIPVDSAPRIAIVTMHDSRVEPVPEDLADWMGLPAGRVTDILAMVWQNRQSYAKRHGYTLIDGTDLIDQSRPVAWSKLLIVKACSSATRPPKTCHSCSWPCGRHH